MSQGGRWHRGLKQGPEPQFGCQEATPRLRAHSLSASSLGPDSCQEAAVPERREAGEVAARHTASRANHLVNKSSQSSPGAPGCYEGTWGQLEHLLGQIWLTALQIVPGLLCPMETAQHPGDRELCSAELVYSEVLCVGPGPYKRWEQTPREPWSSFPPDDHPVCSPVSQMGKQAHGKPGSIQGQAPLLCTT